MQPQRIGDDHEHVPSGNSGCDEYDDNDLYKFGCLIDQEPFAAAERLVCLMGTSVPQIDVVPMQQYCQILNYARQRSAAEYR